MSEAAKPGGGPAKRPVKLPETVGAIPEFGPQEIKKEPNPFTDPDWRMLAYAWAGFLLRVLLILGGVFSAYQYIQARDEKRVERSFELVTLWEEEKYQQAQSILVRRLTELNTRFASDLPANPGEAELAVFHERIGLEAMRATGADAASAEMREAFGRIVYFLNRVGFCVAENLCSRKVADAYFLDFARSFWSYFSGYALEQRRRGSPEFGRAVEDYVRNGR